eukprot:5062821-Ditylum_brightwellii.AAC.1
MRIVLDNVLDCTWRNKGKRLSPIQKAHHTTPKKGTSANCIISHQPGLIPQVTNTLTHTPGVAPCLSWTVPYSQPKVSAHPNGIP